MKEKWPPHFERSEGKEEKERISRRGFLKFLAGAGAAAIGFQAKELERELEYEEAAEPVADNPVVYGIIDYRNERIELGEDVPQKLKEKWKEAYKSDPKLRESLERAFLKMGEWDQYLSDIFEEEGVPAEYRYVAIPESHWNPGEVSPVGAVGPYQFMPKTGEAYELRAEENIDERRDPLFSGKACAKYLKDLYDLVGDWNLALSAYNGGYAQRYVREVKRENETPSYKGFLKFLEGKINAIREEVKNGKVVHTIEKGETLWDIAKRYELEVGDLKDANGLSTDMIKTGDALKIIFSTEKLKQKYFYRKIRGMSENLNYPAKFNAVQELIAEGYAGAQLPALDFEEVETEEDMQTLVRVAEKQGQDPEILKKLNPAILDPLAPLPLHYFVRILREPAVVAKE